HVIQLPQLQRGAYRRATYEAYVRPRAVITDQAYQALQELEGGENLPKAVEGGTYQFVLEVSAVGPAEFAHYAAQLGLDPQQYSDLAAPMGILLDHTDPSRRGKLYDSDQLNL